MWPINDTWSFHAGAQYKNAALLSAQRSIGMRYGASDSAEMFAAKAQLAQYEATRAQFESFAAAGWDSHKMTIYWMLNSHWPSFSGSSSTITCAPVVHISEPEGATPAFGRLRFVRKG